MRDYVRSWLILRDTILDDSHAVLTTPGLPNLFSIYVGADGNADPLGALCRKLEAHQPDADQPFLWEVVAHYSNKCDQPELGDPNPLNRPSEIKWGWLRSQRVLERDNNGKAVVNSAGFKFDPPVEVDDGRITLRISRNEATFDPNQAIKYKDAVNSDTFFGAAAGLAKLMPIEGERAFENGFFYWKVSYEIHFRGLTDPPWQPTVLDDGFCQPNAVAGLDPVQFTDYHGNPLQAPSLLNGNGGLLSKTATTLLGAFGVMDTILHFSATGLWPSFYPFDVLVDSEIVTVLSNVGAGTYNVTRGARGTTPAAHANGAPAVVQPVYLTFQAYPSLPFAALKLP